MEISELAQDKNVKTWFRELAPSTRKGFLYIFANFCNFTGKTPRHLIDEAEKEMRDGVLPRDRRLKRYISDFSEWVTDEFKRKHGREMAPKTFKDHVTAVRSFYSAFEIDLPRNSKRMRQATPLQENRQIPSMEMVREALKYGSVRDRALTLAMLSSGMGDSEITSVRVRDFAKGRGHDPHMIKNWDEWISGEKKKVADSIEAGKLDQGITALEVRRQKTNWDYITFLSPEATLAVLDYLEWRNREPKVEEYRGRYGKSVVTEAYEKRRIKSGDDYLFIKSAVPDEYLPIERLQELYGQIERCEHKLKLTRERRAKLGDRPHNEEIRRLGKSGLTKVFRVLAARIGVSTGFGKWQVFRGHGLRKLFYTLLLNDGCPVHMVDFWMGHKLPEEKAAYFRAVPQKLKEHYTAHVEVLFASRIATQVLQGEEYRVLKSENEAFRSRVAELEQRVERYESKEFLEKLATDPRFLKALLASISAARGPTLIVDEELKE